MNEVQHDERRWRRRSLWLLPPLILLILYWNGHENAARWLEGRELRPQDVAAGAQAPLGGVQWRLHEFSTLKPPANRGWLPGSRAALAVFKVHVESSDLPTRWRGCRIALHDARGRTWLPAIDPVLRVPPTAARGCVAAAHRGALPGSSLDIIEAFMVPPDAVPPWSLSISMDSSRPDYLRFTPPATTPPAAD
ncbi:hypothetical protein [Achromobacter agilis]|uniref:Uncharacterized protein n=1 Tax=Achromobacter agilis TaxID=1353888 RepID=A0A446CHU1_9BURK|nr:hypothetical protein [Achromobacter agilis]SSW67476.1 hypothetical protein AGI3411_03139 [Achromobacter agilis]